MKTLLQVVASLLSVLTGLVFLYSAYTKIWPIEPFEYTIVEYIGINWLPAALLARVLIGVETAAGLLLVFNVWGRRKEVLWCASALLIVFSGYIIYLWASFGDKVNCGCFGDDIWMGPSTSLLKNATMLVVLGFLLVRREHIVKVRWQTYLIAGVTLASLGVPFVINPMHAGEPTWLQQNGYRFNPSGLTIGNSQPPTDVMHGKHVIAFLSQRCSHCRMAAYKMHLMYEHNPTLPFLLVIAGSDNLDDFFRETKARPIPHKRLDKEHFLQYTGGIFPTIILLDNGTVVAKTNYLELSEASLTAWLQKRP
jgi:uncharacterized membrane protein YphA (DoxX/SURF4 family)